TVAARDGRDQGLQLVVAVGSDAGNPQEEVHLGGRLDHLRRRTTLAHGRIPLAGESLDASNHRSARQANSFSPSLSGRVDGSTPQPARAASACSRGRPSRTIAPRIVFRRWLNAVSITCHRAVSSTRTGGGWRTSDTSTE